MDKSDISLAIKLDSIQMRPINLYTYFEWSEIGKLVFEFGISRNLLDREYALSIQPTKHDNFMEYGIIKEIFDGSEMGYKRAVLRCVIQKLNQRVN